MTIHAGSPSQAEWLGHPRGLFYLFFAEMWERFCYYGMRAFLVLYMVKYFRDPDETASGVYGAYTALVYCIALLGGFVADRYLGYRRSIILGGILMAAGEFMLVLNNETVGFLGMSMPVSVERFFFFGGMATIIVGNGYFKPNISTIVGKLYGPNDPRRDAGFTIFYMGINIGALAGGLICGYIGEEISWTLGFLLAGVGMLLGIFTFGTGRRHLGGHGEPRDPDLARRAMPLVLLGSVVLALVFGLLLKYNAFVGYILYALFVGIIIVFIRVMVHETKQQREKMYALMVLTLFNIMFWMMFEQAGNSLTLFADRNIDREIFSWTMPASWVQQFNPIYIILLAPLFSMMWVRLGRRGTEPSIPAKFALGMLQLGLAFAVLVVGCRLFASDGFVPLFFMVVLYLLQTTGELCLSPVGLSMVTKLAPERMTGMVMGFWFLSIAIGNYLAGEIGKLTGEAGGAAGAGPLPPEQSLEIYTRVYQNGAIAILAVSVLLFLMIPLLKRWMHGVK